jgi:hypothetical protein
LRGIGQGAGEQKSRKDLRLRLRTLAEPANTALFIQHKFSQPNVKRKPALKFETVSKGGHAESRDAARNRRRATAIQDAIALIMIIDHRISRSVLDCASPPALSQGLGEDDWKMNGFWPPPRPSSGHVGLQGKASADADLQPTDDHDHVTAALS